MRWGNVFIAEGEDYLISQPLSLVELRFYPVLINVTLLDNGSSGGGREAKFIDIYNSGSGYQLLTNRGFSCSRQAHSQDYHSRY